MIWLRALSFVVAVQLTVIGAIPWFLVRVGPRLPMKLWHWFGIVPLAIGGLALLWCNWAFVVQGRGTAAPYDPPRALVVRGLYRHVRNPMYVSAVLIVFGIGIWTGTASLFGYSILLALSYHLFVRYYEEPHLQRVFGQSYAEYCAAVPRWWPRITPWLGGHLLLVLFLILLGLPGCRSTSAARYTTLVNEGNKILNDQTKSMNRWAREFGQIFSEQNRAQFPANRDELRTRAQKVLPLIEESARLGDVAVEKFEEASRLATRDQDRKGMSLLASSFKKDSEIIRLFKAQAELASDTTINDAKAFNDKFVSLNTLIYEKQKEKDDQFAEGKRLLLTH